MGVDLYFMERNDPGSVQRFIDAGCTRWHAPGCSHPKGPSAEVLNGTVRAGDRIAYAVSSGSSVTMNIAEVLEIGERTAWKDRIIPVLKVRVEQSSRRYPVVPRTVSLDHLDRVVRL